MCYHAGLQWVRMAFRNFSRTVVVGGHALGETDGGQCPKYQDPVIAGKYTSDLISVSFGQQRQSHPGIIVPDLFGSGFAGLGDTSAITEAKLRKSLYAPVIVPENRLA